MGLVVFVEYVIATLQSDHAILNLPVVEAEVPLFPICIHNQTTSWKIQDDKHVWYRRQKWPMWSVLTKMFERKGAKPILQVTVEQFGRKETAEVKAGS